ncbi:MAG: CocE/NonD family hydrolase [Desulfobacteraceae bacterium]|nr:CocE/NonD family hydrolase [Desulfobacteraceae bacterium]
MRCVKSIGVCFLAIMISLLFSPSSGIWCAEKVSEPFKYSGYTSPEYDGFTRTSEYAPMSDGVKLAATIYTPSGGPSTGPFPVLFTYTPYHRESIDPTTGELKIVFSREVVEFFTSYGYTWVFANMRGGGASFGIREAHHSPPLARDGKELVDWIADQPWCDGNVGMIGLSYVAWSSLPQPGKNLMP